MYSRYAQIRDERGFTDLAVAKGSGIPQSTLYDWRQRSAVDPDAETSLSNLKKIAAFLDVELSELVG